MKRQIRDTAFWLLLLIGAMIFLDPAYAQEPVQPYYGVTTSAGRTGFQPVDSTHGLPVNCITGCGGGGGGTQATNITQIGGVAVGATNPLYVAPATAVNPWPVTGSVTSGQSRSTTTMATAAPTALTFASVLASSGSRQACMIQNTGTTTGYVYFGATGSATTSNSFVITAGQSISCTNNNITATDNVAATCASSTCAFVISSQ